MLYILLLIGLAVGAIALIAYYDNNESVTDIDNPLNIIYDKHSHSLEGELNKSIDVEGLKNPPYREKEYNFDDTNNDTNSIDL